MQHAILLSVTYALLTLDNHAITFQPITHENKLMRIFAPGDLNAT